MVIWEKPEQVRGGDPATAIIEAKSLGTDLSGIGKAKQDRPRAQIDRYITGYERAGPNTLGILTDGNVWHIVQGIPNSRQTKYVEELRLIEGTPEEAVLALDELERIILDAAKSSPPERVVATPDARSLTNAISNREPPSKILEMLTGATESFTDLQGRVRLQGKADHAKSTYWDAYAFTHTGRIKAEQHDLTHEALCVAVLRMKKAESEHDRSIYREDVATAASSFAKTSHVGMSILLVIQPDESGNPLNARVAVHHQGHTGMTTEFDPYAPPSIILRSIQRIYDQLRKVTPVSATALADLVASKVVRRGFYESVANDWTLRQYRKAEGSVKERRQYREAILRHLIRTLFVWILKEDDKLPQGPFEPAFAATHAPGAYHEQILTYLFHERLNKPLNQRQPHPQSEIESALRHTRFLNGSLFARHEYDDFRLDDEEYFGTDPEQPGLFTIFSEYDWTASEHTPTHSDQSIDPEVLSNLFENLIAVTETDKTPVTMPQGTYYTPADVAKEMAKDALMMATRNHAPRDWTESEFLDFFGDSDALLPSCKPRERNRLATRIQELTVFDPAVGSGVFPVSMVNAIRVALGKLGRTDEDGSLTRNIISRQIHAQDSNPMAVQVTRLRLFVSIISTEGKDSHLLPLPNLEAKIVCADTLSTVPNRGWSPVTTGGLQDADTNIVRALNERAAIFERWQDAHEESAKMVVRLEDQAARERLRNAARTGIAGRETLAFADHPLLEPDVPPARTDARLLFYKKNWTGFDIVIGNPPYEGIAKGCSASEKKKIRRQLAEKGYTTISCNNLYGLIAEAGLTLTKPEEGVLVLIVPLGICFRQDNECLRKFIECNSHEIRLRSQDNRPSPIFHDSPVAHRENRQRTTILTAVSATHSGQPDIWVTGTNKLPKSQRHSFLKDRAYIRHPLYSRPLDSHLDHQWARIPTPEVSNMIARMRECPVKVRDLNTPAGIRHRNATHDSGAAIGFPETAYNFITAVPAGSLERKEFALQVDSNETLAITMAAANSHVAFVWWRTYGDSFHLNPYEMETLAIPNEWMEIEETRRKVTALGRRLIEAIIPENIIDMISGTKHTERQRLDFHECESETIAEIDQLYLTALGLPIEPLLTQLKVLRSSNTWKIGRG